MPELQQRIGALARRAERLGTSPLALREMGEGEDQHAVVVLEGEPPALAGWTLAAVVDHRGADATLRVVSSRPPGLDPRRFLTPRCDHYGLRRTRVETLVVWHAATQRLRQVGTACLRDFLGGHNPDRLPPSRIRAAGARVDGLRREPASHASGQWRSSRGVRRARRHGAARSGGGSLASARGNPDIVGVVSDSSERRAAPRLR